MRFSTLLLVLTAWGSALCAQTVTMTGILDGTLTGGVPKAIELYVSGTVDLSEFALETRFNANATFSRASQELTGSYTDEFVYLTSSPADFVQVFGSSGDYGNLLTNSAVNGNGDDRFRLVRVADNTVVDQTGGQDDVRANLYLDSYLYRVDATGPDGGWVAANWTIPGNDVLDGLDAAGIRAAVPFGTYVPPSVGPTLSVAIVTNLAEPATDGAFRITLSEPATDAVSVTYTLSGTAAAGIDYRDANGGSATVPAGALSVDVPLSVLDDAISEQTETVIVTVTAVSDATYDFMSANATLTITDDEPLGTTFIHDVQGGGLTSPLVGLTVQVEGVVVGDFQGKASVGLGGFFLQEQDADADADPATSEGIWVYQDPKQAFVEVAEGDVVVVTGTVVEFGGLTELVIGTDADAVMLVGTAALPTVTTIDLPTASREELERYEGMRVDFAETLVVTDVFDLTRFGSVTVSEGERLIQFTECNEPDASALAAYQAQQQLRTLIVDDGRSAQNLTPTLLPTGGTLSPSNTLRAGNSLLGLTGVLDERFTGYRLQSTAPATQGTENARPTTAPAVGGDLRVASMNVLNYFNGDGLGGGFPTARGAQTPEAFARQQTKIVAAICELDAAAVGLLEIENDGYGPQSAIQSLVDAVEAECGLVYEFVRAPNTGTDEIQVALIYQPAVLAEAGTAAALATPTDVFSRSRVPLAQTFRVVEPGNASFGESLTLAVNHFKSKGCGNASGADADQGDGQGCWNATRTATAAAVRDWLATAPTGTSDPDYLVLGDLNAYRNEDPITTLTSAGYVNTVVAAQPEESFPCGGSPSYTFQGQWGSLDYMLASSTLADQVTGAADWAVNAAESPSLDYNDVSLYAPDFYRFSDHDPLVAGLRLGNQPLPVILVDFGATASGEAVKLTWATASEVGTERFEVERADARDAYGVIGSVRARGHAATYAFDDRLPASPEATLYRLRIVDADGTVAFSQTVAVRSRPDSGLRVVGQVGGTISVAGVPSGAQCQLVDGMGRIVVTSSPSVADGSFDLAVGHLPKGLYILRALQANGEMSAIKLVLR